MEENVNRRYARSREIVDTYLIPTFIFFMELGPRIMPVKDTGCGISREQLKELFTPFYTTKKGGVGLGLIITQEIVKSHGGEMTVMSESGRGTQVAIAFPAG